MHRPAKLLASSHYERSYSGSYVYCCRRDVYLVSARRFLQSTLIELPTAQVELSSPA